jgi:hypothetical protein
VTKGDIMDRSKLAQEGYYWRTLVNTVMNIWVA